MTRGYPCLILFCALLLVCCFSLSRAAQQADDAAIQRYSRGAEEAMARKDADAAILALEKLAHLTPNNPEVFANLGAVYYAQGRYSEAAEAFHRALHLNPKIPNVPLMLGMCDAELGRLQEAVPILRAGLSAIRRTLRWAVRLVLSYWWSIRPWGSPPRRSKPLRRC